MTQTDASKLAYARDRGLCQWHLNKLSQRVSVFAYREGFISAYAGTHHVFRRNRVDEVDAIISLCSECHQRIELAQIPKIQVVALLSKITGVDLYRKHREFCKWGDETWEQALREIGPVNELGFFAAPEI